jgi:hypothetical protein
MARHDPQKPPTTSDSAPSLDDGIVTAWPESKRRTRDEATVGRLVCCGDEVVEFTGTSNRYLPATGGSAELGAMMRG